MNRRKFLSRSLATLALSRGAAHGLLAQDAKKSAANVLPPWGPGWLEIHHISTNRGKATLLILPDGTAMLVGAGAVYPTAEDPLNPTQLRPSDERRPGQWIGRYVQRRLLENDLYVVHYFVAPQISEDEVGGMPPNPTQHPDGYVLTGITDVAQIVPIYTYLDRGWPDYNYPVPLDAPFQQNYHAFLKAQQKDGAKVARFQVATRDQIPLMRRPMTFPTCEVRNIASNGDVWSGETRMSIQEFPKLKTLKPEDYPTEDMCSSVLRIRYGRFRYYIGGELTSDTRDGTMPWRDIESPVARAVGKVSVAVANNHGSADANGEDMVAELKPKVFVVPSYGSAQPSQKALATMASKEIYPDNRDIFTTSIKDASTHVVVRVDPGGQNFQVYLLSNADETDQVVAKSGPYSS